MVLESIISPFKAKKRPYELFFIGFIYSTIAMVLSLTIFPRYASLVMVFLTTLASVPLLYVTINNEEEISYSYSGRLNVLKEHWKMVSFFVFLFLGFVFSFAFWYVVLPFESAQPLYSIQAQAISEINGGAVSSMDVSSTGVFLTILSNNFKVLAFSILFSFIFGSGAIFILTWNASVVATAIGVFIKNYIYGVNSSSILSYTFATGTALMRYMVHGIPEMVAYIVAALAGGIISFALIKKDVVRTEREKIMMDAALLLAISIVILLAAALIEVYITPRII